MNRESAGWTAAVLAVGLMALMVAMQQAWTAGRFQIVTGIDVSGSSKNYSMLLDTHTGAARVFFWHSEGANGIALGHPLLQGVEEEKDDDAAIDAMIRDGLGLGQPPAAQRRYTNDNDLPSR
jgi:hypothetical protein